MEITPKMIMNGIQKANVDLTNKNIEYQQFQEEAAHKERIYRIEYRKALLKLKSDGNSITLIRDLASGLDDVSQKKLEWDLSIAMVKTCKSAMENLHGALDSYRSLLTWLRAEMEQR